jgi:hypothetical protein
MSHHTSTPLQRAFPRSFIFAEDSTMKSAVLALAALVATTAAQSLAPLSVQSKPFRLVLHSGNASFDS